VAYLSTNLGACIIFPFSAVVHMAMGNCMDAIRLNGNVWIILPLRQGKCELGEHDRTTACLGKCLFGAEIFTCYTHVYMEVPHVWVVSSCVAMPSLGRGFG